MPTADEKLAQKRYVTVMLRLVMDTRGRMVYGEIVDDSAKSWGHFVGWRELIRLTRAYLLSVKNNTL